MSKSPELFGEDETGSNDQTCILEMGISFDIASGGTQFLEVACTM
jgi:hypothetical protein